jgi:protein-S-isoprenylcysteine O-methyltransferase Ste14
VLAFVVVAGMVAAATGAVVLWRWSLLAHGFEPPALLRVVGWGVLVIAVGFGFVADRQLGIRVRAFMPFFEDRGRIALKTTGAYAIVRHPIYAAGIGFQLGVFLASGIYAVAAASAVLAIGAAWFTREEERHLVELLADPAAYETYRKRVPRLLPWPRPR